MFVIRLAFTFISGLALIKNSYDWIEHAIDGGNIFCSVNCWIKCKSWSHHSIDRVIK